MVNETNTPEVNSETTKPPMITLDELAEILKARAAQNAKAAEEAQKVTLLWQYFTLLIATGWDVSEDKDGKFLFSRGEDWIRVQFFPGEEPRLQAYKVPLVEEPSFLSTFWDKPIVQVGSVVLGTILTALGLLFLARKAVTPSDEDVARIQGYNKALTDQRNLEAMGYPTIVMARPEDLRMAHDGNGPLMSTVVLADRNSTLAPPQGFLHLSRPILIEGNPSLQNSVFTTF